MKILLITIPILLLFACSTPKEMRTDGIPPAKNFELNRYLGKWYEIARLPNRFEEGLTDITASYSLKENGDILVVNRGYDSSDAEWSESEANAWVPDPEKPAMLKVQFFWPFSAKYKVLHLAEDYSYAMVTSSSKDYLWFLARQPEIDLKTYDLLLKMACGWGFDTDKLIRVDQNRNIE